MRRIFIISGVALVAGALLCSETAFAQSTHDPNASNAASVYSSKATHKVAGVRRAKAARKNHSKRPEYRSEYKQNAVEVINGSASRRVVFNDDNKNIGTAKNRPSPLRVEVLNGTSTDTRYFYVDKNHPQEQAINATPQRPVVVGIESSNTRVAGGNKHPVVTAIMDANSADASAGSQNGQKLTTGVSPEPKRKPYQP